MSKPDVTSPEWVDWALEEMRRERAEAAEAAGLPSDSVPEAPASVAEVPEPAEVHRRRPVVGVVAAAVALAAVLAGGWWWLGQPDQDPDDRALSVAAGSRTGPPPSPVRLSAGDEHTVVRVLASGDLAVQQWVRSRGETRYRHDRLSGALELSGDNRALARLPQIVSGKGQYTIDFVGATILSLACTPLVEDALPVPCGADAGVKGWRVVRPAGLGDVRVMAQLDLTLG
jgi:hypothetical protein